VQNKETEQWLLFTLRSALTVTATMGGAAGTGTIEVTIMYSVD